MIAQSLLFLALLTPALVLAAEDIAPVQAVLDKQVADWNRGDIPAFVQTYAENCTFVGKTVTEGRAAVEERYRRTYPTSAAMGHLTFSNLKIKILEGRIAIVTGAFHLQRDSAAGGDASGLFSLVLEHQAKVWRIVLDHTS
jgi:uncharacterized protein (TIGR02246 family)